MKKQINWMNGLKTLACFGVLYCHFVDTFCEGFLKTNTTSFITIFNTTFSALSNGGFWVVIFCILSGYFATRKKHDSFNELFKSIIKRYLRFVIPLFLSSLVILAVDKTIGFLSVGFSKEISNVWLSKYFVHPISITNIAKYIFLFDNKINAPIATIKFIYLGTIIIYFIEFLFKNKIAKRCQMHIAPWL